MKWKAALIVALLSAFILGFISTAQAQTDPEFKAFLARLNGSRWVFQDDQETKCWLELQGEMMTRWVLTKDSRKTEKSWRVKVEKRRFVNRRGSVFEISPDGAVITEEITHRTDPAFNNVVLKWLKEK